MPLATPQRLELGLGGQCEHWPDELHSAHQVGWIHGFRAEGSVVPRLQQCATLRAERGCRVRGAVCTPTETFFLPACIPAAKSRLVW